MPWNKDGSRKAFYKKSYKKSGFKMKKHSSFKLNNDKDKQNPPVVDGFPIYPANTPGFEKEKYPTEKYTGSKYTVGVVPFSGGAGKGGKTLTNLFNKKAKTVSKQIKQLEKMLKESGKTLKRSPKSKSRGNL